MTSRPDLSLFNRLKAAQPNVRAWMEEYKETTAHEAQSVGDLSIPGLSRCYPIALLESTRVVVTDEIRYPPLAEFGLAEFKDLNATSWSGLTYNDVYFLRRDVVCPALHFHELVHVVQYRRLGIERFLWAYGVQLALHGYDNSPFEKMAYDLQLEFEHQILRRSLVTDIERQSDRIWEHVCSQERALSGADKSL
jgi:hypothetical protein